MRTARWMAPMVAVALVASGACGGAGDDVGTDAGDGLTAVATIPGELNRAIDLLLVVDNSGGMIEPQWEISNRLPALIDALATAPGGLPDLHLGVVSTDVGTDGVDVIGCSSATRSQGDDGELRANDCAQLQASFLSDQRNPDGTRARNYSGDLAAALGCMVLLGTTGCGFEQPLESMRRALSPGKNPGFLRADALLGVLILSDEDDCSALPGGGLFGDPMATITSPLGPRTSFRCFEFGVQCADDPDPRAFGTKAGCVPRTGSPYMPTAQSYVEFLRALKTDPRQVVVSVIAGAVDAARTAEVGASPDSATVPALAPSCASSLGLATPALRLRAFVDGFPARGAASTICKGDQTAAMAGFGDLVRTAQGSPCIAADLVDTAPATAGLQPRCEVTEYTVTGGVRSNPVVIPGCVVGGPQPCWRLEADAAACPRAVANQALTIDRATPPAADSEVEARCEVRP